MAAAQKAAYDYFSDEKNELENDYEDNEHDDDDDNKLDNLDDFNYNCSHLIRIRGLPWSTTKKEICDFFTGVNILNGENGVHLITFAGKRLKPLGEAYIQLASEEDFNLAQTFNRKNLGSRYIEVFTAKVEDFQNIMSKQRIVMEERVLRLRGLPWNATEKDIADFFKGLELDEENGIHIHYDWSGRVSGEAFVRFRTNEDCEKALKRNMEKLGHRYIEIFRSTEHHLLRSIAQTEKIRGGANNGNFGGGRNHPYDRNGGNIENRLREMRNMRNMRGSGGRGDRRNDISPWTSDLFSNNRNSSNRNNFNDFDDISRNNFGNNMRGNNGNFNNNGGNFFDDYDLNGFGNGNSSNGGNNNFGFNGGNINGNNFGNRNFDFNLNGRGIGNNSNFGSNNFGGSNEFNSFGNNMNDRIFNDGGNYCVHLRGMPYYCDESDMYKFFAPLKPSNCKVVYNNKGMHSGEADALFDTHDEAMLALRKDKEKMGSRYIELFYDRPNVKRRF